VYMNSQEKCNTCCQVRKEVDGPSSIKSKNCHQYMSVCFTGSSVTPVKHNTGMLRRVPSLLVMGPHLTNLGVPANGYTFLHLLCTFTPPSYINLQPSSSLLQPQNSANFLTGDGWTAQTQHKFLMFTWLLIYLHNILHTNKWIMPHY